VNHLERKSETELCEISSILSQFWTFNHCETMDKQHTFLSNNIFDIDSALDHLEENLWSSEEKLAISTEPLSQQQKNEIVNLQQQQSKEPQEENGNVVALIDSVGDSVTEDDNKGDFFSNLKKCS
jgi:hypothetical protein